LFWEKGGGRGVGAPFPPKQPGVIPPRTDDDPLIQFVELCVKRLFELGKKYPWPEPKGCPRCGGGLWGHGYCAAYFDGFHEPLWLKRYRCPGCGAVIRMRPQGYWSRFQATVATIRESLSRRVLHGRWLPWLARSRQRHWWQGLRTQVAFHLGPGWTGDWLCAFDWLDAKGVIAASRSIQCEIPPESG
jgi:hypothetical protein